MELHDYLCLHTTPKSMTRIELEEAKELVENARGRACDLPLPFLIDRLTLLKEELKCRHELFI